MVYIKILDKKKKRRKEAATAFKYCLLLYLNEKKIFTGKKKKKEREIRPQPGPSDVLHHCSGTKLFLGLKKAKGN